MRGSFLDGHTLALFDSGQTECGAGDAYELGGPQLDAEARPELLDDALGAGAPKAHAQTMSPAGAN